MAVQSGNVQITIAAPWRTFQVAMQWPLDGQVDQQPPLADQSVNTQTVNFDPSSVYERNSVKIIAEADLIVHYFLVEY